MAKIIRIKDNVISVGKEDGSFFDINGNEIDFQPTVGDEVDIFVSGNNTIISKTNNHSSDQSSDGGYTQGNPVNVQVVNQVIQGKLVNQVAYALLAILLGDFGVHKFYAGKVGLGILYLLFCWTFIPSIIGLIEGIIAFTKNADNNGKIIV